MKNNELTSIMAAEDFLRRLFLLKLDDENLKTLLMLVNDMPKSLQDSEFVALLAGLSDSALDEFRWEFNSLFILKPKVPASQSAYCDKSEATGARMFEASTFLVRSFYERAGLSLSRELLDKFPDDFIGYELQFLYYLSFLLLDENSDKKELLAIRNEFIKDCVFTWFDEFAMACKEQANSKEWASFGDFLTLYLACLKS